MGVVVVVRTRVDRGPVGAWQIWPEWAMVGMVVIEKHGSRRAELVLRGSRGTIGVALWLRRQRLSCRRRFLLVHLFVLRGLLLVFHLLFRCGSWLLRDN